MGRGLRARAGTAGVAAGALVLALAPIGEQPDSAGASPLPEGLGPMRGDPSELDDGRGHIVVAFAEGGPASPSPGDDTGGFRRVPVPEVDGVADPEVLAALAGEGRVVRLERDLDGRLVALVQGATDAAAGAETADEERLTALRAVPGTVDVEPIGGGWYAVTTDGDPASYEAMPGVRSVVQDVVLSVSADPYLDSQWHLANDGRTVANLAGVAGADIGATEAWAAADGDGVVVAVVDSGMEISHPDLAGSILRNDDDCGDGVDDDANGYVDDCAGWDFLNGDNTVQDSGPSRYGGSIDNTHATHVAGIVAATRDNGIGVAGVAPRARILPLKVSDASSMSMSTIAAAIRYAVDNGADIINCSFGSAAGTPLAAVAPMQEAIRYAGSRGVLVVAAAGNDNRDIDAVPTYPASFPEANLIAVGASTNADTRASFSNWGATSVDLFAPGWSITSTLPGAGYGGLHGTSMAAPVVAGAAALVLDAEPALDLAAVKNLLLTASTPIAELAGRSVSGQRLDIGRILNPSGAQAQEPVAFTFDGFAGRQAGETIDATIDAAIDPAVVPAGAAVAYRATLLTAQGGVPYGVSGAAVRTSEGTVLTDELAAVALSPSGGFAAADASRPLPLAFSLPAGEYALVASAHSTLDGAGLGRPWAVFFTVAEPGQEPPPATVAPVPTTLPTSPTAPPPGGGGGGGGGSTPTTWYWGGGGGGSTPTTWYWGGGGGGGSTPTTWYWGGGGGGSTPTTWYWGGGGGGSTPTTWYWGGGGGGGSTPTTWYWGGGGGGSTPTTWQWPAPPPTTPAPTTPAPTSPPTTRPPSTGGATPTTQLPPPPGPVTVGGLTVRALDPRWGPTTGGTRVRIDGDGFVGTVRVLFGSTPGTGVTVLSSTSLLVTAPVHATPGTVDVRVSTAADSAVLPGAFTYLAGDSGAPSPGGGGPAPTTPVTVAPTTPAPPTTASSTTATTAQPPPPAPVGWSFAFGEVAAARGDLQLRPLLPGSPLDGHPPSTWPPRRCVTTPCTATEL